jgi:SAM-dependent methyltransferase
MADVPEFSATSEINADQIIEFFQSLARGSQVLDVGPGKGAEALLAMQAGLSVTGIDVAPKILERFKEAAPDAKAIVGDMRALPLADESFDAVLACNSVLHLDRSDGIKALSEFNRVLKRGGKMLLVTTLGNGDEELNQRAWLKEHGIDCWYFYHWQPDDLRQQVESAGFQILKVHQQELIAGRPPVAYLSASKD